MQGGVEDPCASVSPRVGAYRLAYQQIERIQSAITNVIGSSSASGSETRVETDEKVDDSRQPAEVQDRRHCARRCNACIRDLPASSKDWVQHKDILVVKHKKNRYYT